MIYPFYDMFHLGFSFFGGFVWEYPQNMKEIKELRRAFKTESRTLPSALLPAQAGGLNNFHSDIPSSGPCAKTKLVSMVLSDALSVCICDGPFSYLFLSPLGFRVPFKD